MVLAVIEASMSRFCRMVFRNKQPAVLGCIQECFVLWHLQKRDQDIPGTTENTAELERWALAAVNSKP